MTNFGKHLIVALMVIASASAFSQNATHVVISEVYGGGGNTNSYWKNDFIELYNPTDSIVNLSGWSVQYGSSSLSTYSPTVLSGMIAPKGFFLIQEAQGAGGTQPLPTPDVTGTLAMGSTAGKIVLSNGSNPVSGISDPTVVDFVGYGTAANAYEGTGPTPAPSNSTSVERKANSSSTSSTLGSGGSDEFAGNGYDSNNNASDFVTRSMPQPQNSAGGTEPVSTTDNVPPFVVRVKPLSNISVEVLFNEPVDSASAGAISHYTFAAGSSVTTAARDTLAHARVLLSVSAMADGIYSLTVDGVADTAGNVQTSQTFAFSVGVLTVAQARAATPGTNVRVRGILTVGNEFGSPSFLQDTTGGIGLFNSTFSLNAHIGDLWEVAGNLKNYNGLLELDPLTDTIRVSSHNPVPAPLVIPSTGLNESVEGRLVRINKVKFELSGTFGTTDSSYAAGDSAGTFTVRIDNSTGIGSSPLPVDSVNVVGIVNEFYGAYRLMPRNVADIGVVDPPPAQTWQDMSVARAMGAGAVVKVRGVVTHVQAGATRNTIFFQDATGGVAVYDPLSDALLAGDSVEVKGTLVDYRTFLEIQPAESVTVMAQGITLPSPLRITTAEASEYYESRLLTVKGVRFVETGLFTANTTYHVTDGITSLDVRITALSPLAGTSIPLGALDLTGVLGAFDSRYQLIPRTASDFTYLPGPQITSIPSISDQTEAGFAVNWATMFDGTSVLYYGPGSSLRDSIVVDTLSTSHRIAVAGLPSGRIYSVQAISRNGSGESISPVVVTVTTSPASSGTMNVYFNYPVDTTLAVMPKANGSVSLLNKLLERISAATQSIDMALYSFDDFSSSPDVVANRIADSLIAAKARGVAIRMVVRLGLNTTPLGRLTTAGIPVMRRNVQELGSGMHNKFMIFDGRDTLNATDDWVITGSWNLTNTGTVKDGQNAVFIQDQSLARIYTAEFEEMFGSSTNVPDPAAARFGPTKKDNTPHSTIVGGRLVEVFFSPSDGTTSALNRILKTANRNIFFGQLTFTRSDLAATVAERKSAGVLVRGIIDNTGDNGSQFSFMQSAGIDVLAANHSVVTGQFHHKYSIVDPFSDADDPVVTTGSHNWSSSAENDNDENTIIIHSGDIARQYVQEFAKRYAEAGGAGTIVSVSRENISVPLTAGLDQNYPNPFNPTTTIRYTLAGPSKVTLKVYDVLGREVANLADGDMAGGIHTAAWNAGASSSGVYFCRLTAGGRSYTITMLLLK